MSCHLQFEVADDFIPANISYLECSLGVEQNVAKRTFYLCNHCWTKVAELKTALLVEQHKLLKQAKDIGQSLHRTLCCMCGNRVGGVQVSHCSVQSRLLAKV
eukprot:1608063-Amphidinium_carterae.1